MLVAVKQLPPLIVAFWLLSCSNTIDICVQSFICCHYLPLSGCTVQWHKIRSVQDVLKLWSTCSWLCHAWLQPKMHHGFHLVILEKVHAVWQDMCIYGHIMSLVWNYNRQIRSAHECFWSVAFICCRYLAWSSSADICLHGSRPQAPPTASTGESSALWFLDREAGPAGQGKHRILLSSTASPLAGLNFQLKTRTQKKGPRVGCGT